MVLQLVQGNLNLQDLLIIPNSFLQLPVMRVLEFMVDFQLVIQYFYLEN